MARRSDRHFAGYFGSVVGAVLIVLTGIFALNLAVDPLWYAGGNKLTGRNFAFDERLTKANLFRDRRDGVDCIILGSSKVSLLPASSIGGGRHCFNYSFSAAGLGEMTDVLRYLARRGFRPDLVIVGIDDYQFYQSPPSALPAFYAAGEPPPPPVPTYLTLDALAMSLRTLTGDSPVPRYYDRHFEARVPATSRDYGVPVDTEAAIARRGAFLENLVAPPRVIDPDRTHAALERLTAVFPEAVHVAYTPPMSDWYRTAMAASGEWQAYVETLIGVAGLFDTFCDFSSVQPAGFSGGSYDGVHFARRVNAQIAETLAGPDRCGVGTDVLAESRDRLLRAGSGDSRPEVAVTRSANRS